jgi:hypothetical protein
MHQKHDDPIQHWRFKWLISSSLPTIFRRWAKRASMPLFARMEANKGLQEIATETSNYCKKAFEQATLTFEQLLGVKSLEQAIEIQSQYMKKGYDAHVAEVSKLGEMYVSLAQSLYKPFEKVVAKRAA